MWFIDLIYLCVCLCAEAHERNPDADYLLPLLGFACRERPQFKAIVMSATIDVRIFSGSMTKCLTDKVVPLEEFESWCPVIEVAGVTFPVEDHYWKGEDEWDPEDKDTLVKEVVRIFKKEETGNILVFLNSIRSVTECVELTINLMSNGKNDSDVDDDDDDDNDDGSSTGSASDSEDDVSSFSSSTGSSVGEEDETKDSHDDDVTICEELKEGTDEDIDMRKVAVMPLFASLDEEGRNAVVDFCSLPQNKNRRMICFSTNVAEAGITIPGVVAVVETGREISMTYDYVSKVNVGSVAWISKASQIQRRGRAGRTAPGRCYCMYSEDDFASKMPMYSEPPVQKINLESFYLGLVANGK
jgi:HrpA-like RNA helicase